MDQLVNQPQLQPQQILQMFELDRSNPRILDVRAKELLKEILTKLRLYKDYNKTRSTVQDCKAQLESIQKLVERLDINPGSQIEYREDLLSRKDAAKKRSQRGEEPTVDDYCLEIYFHNTTELKTSAYYSFYTGYRIKMTDIPVEYREKINYHPYRVLNYQKNLKKKIASYEEELRTLLNCFNNVPSEKEEKELLARRNQIVQTNKGFQVYISEHSWSWEFRIDVDLFRDRLNFLESLPVESWISYIKNHTSVTPEKLQIWENFNDEEKANFIQNTRKDIINAYITQKGAMMKKKYSHFTIAHVRAPPSTGLHFGYDTETDISELQCVICTVNKKAILLEACDHVCVCAGCMKHLYDSPKRVCPVCREGITKWRRVYI